MNDEWGKFCVLLLLLIMLAALSGCSSIGKDRSQERYFSPEEDAKARETCEAAGCVIVPTPIWNQILQRLQGVRT